MTNKIFFAVVVIAFSIYLIYAFRMRGMLINRHTLTNGIVLSVNSGGRANAGTIFVNFNFDVLGKVFTSAVALPSAELSYGTCQRHFIGRSFPVVYNPSTPKLSNILILPEQFKAFGYDYPDSLQWVLQYVSK